MTTLNDWKKGNSNRNKLYQLLISLDEGDVIPKLNKKTNHRFFYILNKNVDDNSMSSFDEIRKALVEKIIRRELSMNKLFIQSSLKN